MASGIACRLHQANFKRIVMLETASPLAVRRQVSFSEAVYEKTQAVEELTAERISSVKELEATWKTGRIAVTVDPDWQFLKLFSFDVTVDAILAKKNLGTNRNEAGLVIGLGPGFTAGEDVHRVIETRRGHNLGRILTTGKAEENTGIPGNIGGYTSERVLRAPGNGIFNPLKSIGDRVVAGTIIGTVGDVPVQAQIGGIVRGLIRGDIETTAGLKLGDIDPRGNPDFCGSVSEKARAIGGAVLEAILNHYNR